MRVVRVGPLIQGGPRGCRFAAETSPVAVTLGAAVADGRFRGSDDHRPWHGLKPDNNQTPLSHSGPSKYPNDWESR